MGGVPGYGVDSTARAHLAFGVVGPDCDFFVVTGPRWTDVTVESKLPHATSLNHERKFFERDSNTQVWTGADVAGSGLYADWSPAIDWMP